MKLNGWWPTTAVLERFAREADIRMGSLKDLTVAARLAAAATLLTDEGVPLPADSGPPKDAKTREIKLPAAPLPGAPLRSEHDRQWNEAACIEAMERWLAGLSAGAKRTRAKYVSFQAGKPEFPSASAFAEYGGFNAIKRAAEAKLRGR